jgi:hypothetical protein
MLGAARRAGADRHDAAYEVAGCVQDAAKLLRLPITPAGRGAGAGQQASTAQRSVPHAIRMSWARRLKRAFGIEIELCVRCGRSDRTL